jgi:hypothetical protein
MLRNLITTIDLAVALALGGIVSSTAALARGGGFGGSHFGGGHFGGLGGHMSGHFGRFHGGHERHGLGGYGYSPYSCDHPYRFNYPGCY